MDINIIGTITRSIPTDDPEVFDTVTLDGWHVMSTFDFGIDLDDYLSTELARSLMGGFFGVESFHYTFSSQEEFETLYGEGITPQKRLTPESYSKEKNELAEEYQKDMDVLAFSIARAIALDGSSETAKRSSLVTLSKNRKAKYSDDLSNLKLKYGY